VVTISNVSHPGHPVSQWGATLAGMKKIEVWKWRLRSLTGRVHVTQYRMTEAEALQRDPTAVREPGTMLVREMPDTADELAALMPGAGVRSGLVGRKGWWRQPVEWGPDQRKATRPVV